MRNIEMLWQKRKLKFKDRTKKVLFPKTKVKDIYMRDQTKFNENNTWTYQNGELYHYGRPGMKWGKTIFGGIDNPKSLIYDPNYGKERFPFKPNSSQSTRRERPSSSASERVISKINNRPKNSGSVSGRKRPSASAAERIADRIPNSSGSTTNTGRKRPSASAAERIADRIPNSSGSTTNNSPKHGISVQYGDPIENRKKPFYKIGNEFLDNRDNYDRHKEHTLESDRNTHLELAVAKQIQDGEEAYGMMMTNRRTKDMLNLAIQNAQYNIVSGLNNLVRNLGIDKQVDSFLDIFLGDKKSTKNPSSSQKQNEPYSYDQGKPMTQDEYEARRAQDYENMLYRWNPTGNNSNSEDRKKIQEWQDRNEMPFIQGVDKINKVGVSIPGGSTPYSDGGYMPSYYKTPWFDPHNIPTYEQYEELKEDQKEADEAYRKKYWDDYLRSYGYIKDL
jgi:hypothetical protein